MSDAGSDIPTHAPDGRIVGGPIPLAMIRAGIVAQMDAQMRGVYIVLAAHADGYTGEAYPSVETIGRLLGRGERTVQQAVSALARLGVIVADRTGGRGRSTRYVLTADVKGRNYGCALSGPKGRRKTPKRAQKKGEKGAAMAAPQQGNREQTPPPPPMSTVAHGGGGGDAAPSDALGWIAHATTRTELARRQDLTPDVIGEVRSRARAQRTARDPDSLAVAWLRDPAQVRRIMAEQPRPPEAAPADRDLLTWLDRDADAETLARAIEHVPGLPPDWRNYRLWVLTVRHMYGQLRQRHPRPKHATGTDA